MNQERFENSRSWRAGALVSSVLGLSLWAFVPGCGGSTQSSGGGGSGSSASQSSSSSTGTGSVDSCDPMKESPCSDPVAVCSAETKTCDSPPACNATSQCTNHHACVAHSCAVSCYESGAPNDKRCDDGYVCDSKSGSCIQATGSCDIPGQSVTCGGYLCDAKTKKCVAPIRCTDDSVCNGYACYKNNPNPVTPVNFNAPYCYVSCQGDGSCASGYKCAMDNTCVMP